MSHDANVFIGIDVGTSTCQAYGGVGSARPLDPDLQGDSRADYPSAMLQLADGTWKFGFDAQRGATRARRGDMYHENFKAYMKPDHPLAERYTVDEAVHLFQSCAKNFAQLVLPQLMQLVAYASAPRVDLAWTMPAGWRRFPELEETYRSALADIRAEVAGRHTGASIHSHMIEEPVAALLSLESAIQNYPQDSPILVLDAGGGTLDAAVLSYSSLAGLPNFTVHFTRSVGLAGAALFRAWLSVLQQQRDVFKPNLPSDWEDIPSLRLDLEALFRNYHRWDDEVSGQFRPHDMDSPPVSYAFSRVLVESELRKSSCVEAQGEFLDGLLDEYNAFVPDHEELYGWEHVVMAGGLSRSPVFRDLVKTKFPAARGIPDPTFAIAKGAAELARMGGRQIEGRRLEFDIAQRLLQQNTEKYCLQTLVRRGTILGKGSRGEASCYSYARRDTSTINVTLFLANGTRYPEDVVRELADANISFGRPIRKEDRFLTEVEFDAMLRLKIVETHLPGTADAKIELVTESLAWE